MVDWSRSLRPVQPSDVSDLRKNCFPDLSLSVVLDYVRWCLLQMDKGRMLRLVVEADGQVVANGQLTIRRSWGEIGSLIVAPRYRRQGIGKALLGALVKEAHKRQVHTLEILADPAVPWLQAWYQEHGFSYCGAKILPRDERVAVLRMSESVAD